jgi:hypothetical protein
MTPSRTSWYFFFFFFPKVYAASNYTAVFMKSTLDGIRQRSLFPAFELPALTFLQIDSPLAKIAISPKPETLKPQLAALYSTHLLTSPYAHPRGVIGEELNKLLAPFRNLEIADFIDEVNPSLQSYGLDRPSRIFLKAGEESIELLIGNEVEGKHYAKLADAPAVFTLSGMESVLNARPFTLVEKFVLLVNIDWVDHLSITGGGRNLTADFTGHEDDRIYLLNGKKAEENSFKAFYESVISLMLEAEYPRTAAPAGQNNASGELRIEYQLNTPPGERASFTLIPYNRDFYALSQEGATEFLVSRNQVNKIFEAADRVVY